MRLSSEVPMNRVTTNGQQKTRARFIRGSRFCSLWFAPRLNAGDADLLLFGWRFCYFIGSTGRLLLGHGGFVCFQHCIVGIDVALLDSFH